MIDINPAQYKKKANAIDTVGSVSDITASIAGLVGKGADDKLDPAQEAFKRRQANVEKMKINLGLD